MVKYQDALLDRTFAALADPTRRALLARLDGADSLTVSELAGPFRMTLPAVMKHLAVLSDAGLVAREKSGRVVACRLTAGPMEQATQWLNRYRRFWTENLDRLAEFVESEQWTPKSTPARASPSNAASRARPSRSSPRGRTPRK